MKNSRRHVLTDHEPLAAHAPAWRDRALACALAAGLVSLSARTAVQEGAAQPAATTLRDSRVVLGKWIEAQQILSKERNDWQQGREVLGSRIELLRREVLGLQEKVQEAKQRIADANAKKEAELARGRELETTGAQLTTVVATLEEGVRGVFRRLPEPVATRLAPLRQRIPEPNAETRAGVAERFQNVLGILNELNKANNELHVAYEVHDLADGKPSEVRVLYVGLAQAFYVSASGHAGIGRPSEQGWKWEPSPSIADEVLTSLEIIQGKQTPAFVPLPVRIQ